MLEVLACSARPIRTGGVLVATLGFATEVAAVVMNQLTVTLLELAVLSEMSRNALHVWREERRSEGLW